MDKELRFLRQNEKQKICQLIGDNWKNVMGEIPSDRFVGKKRFDVSDGKRIFQTIYSLLSNSSGTTIIYFEENCRPLRAY